MPPTHYKIKRKELKQPDEFVTLVGSARDFLFENWRKMAISAAVVLAVGLIALGTYSYERGRDRAASERFFTALGTLNAKHYQAAGQQLSKLADDEPDRKIGRLARLYLAIAYMGANDLPKARDTLVQFVAEEHDPVFASLALADLGVVYERMGDYQKAAGAYQQAAAAPGPEQVRAQLGVARMLAKAGDKQGAIGVYRDFLAAHPFAQQRGEVLESLALLGATPAPKPAVGRPPATLAAPSH
jgi:predicted negative regulator of RcsB-dependent stress response